MAATGTDTRTANPAAGWAGSGQVRAGDSVDWITRFGLVATVALLFAISGGMLWLVGYNYDCLLYTSPSPRD